MLQDGKIAPGTNAQAPPSQELTPSLGPRTKPSDLYTDLASTGSPRLSQAFYQTTWQAGDPVDPACASLLKPERLRRELSLCDLAQGLCSVSTLSKLERGLQKADLELLRQLYQRLDIHFNCNEALLSQAASLISSYFSELIFSLPHADAERLWRLEPQLRHSPLAIDLALARCFEADELGAETRRRLQHCREILPERQRAWLDLSEFWYRDAGADPKLLESVRQAHRILRHSLSGQLLLEKLYDNGRYGEVLERSAEVETLALREGNVYRLAALHALRGTVFACLELDGLFEQEYQLSSHFLAGSIWHVQRMDADYNLGATYLGQGRLDLARYYLEKVTTPSFLCEHKLALLAARQGHFSEATVHLAQMQRQLSRQNMKDSALLVQATSCELDYLGHPSDEGAVRLIRALEDLRRLHLRMKRFGFVIFYEHTLKQLYIERRQYKKALELSEQRQELGREAGLQAFS